MPTEKEFGNLFKYSEKQRKRSISSELPTINKDELEQPYFGKKPHSLITKKQEPRGVKQVITDVLQKKYPIPEVMSKWLTKNLGDKINDINRSFVDTENSLRRNWRLAYSFIKGVNTLKKIASFPLKRTVIPISMLSVFAYTLNTSEVPKITLNENEKRDIIEQVSKFRNPNFNQIYFLNKTEDSKQVNEQYLKYLTHKRCGKGFRKEVKDVAFSYILQYKGLENFPYKRFGIEEYRKVSIAFTDLHKHDRVKDLVRELNNRKLAYEEQEINSILRYFERARRDHYADDVDKGKNPSRHPNLIALVGLHGVEGKHAYIKAKDKKLFKEYLENKRLRKRINSSPWLKTIPELEKIIETGPLNEYDPYNFSNHDVFCAHRANKGILEITDKGIALLNWSARKYNVLYRKTGNHSGIDLPCKPGDTAYAVKAGRVCNASGLKEKDGLILEIDSKHGGLVRIDGSDWLTCYAHLIDIFVNSGDFVFKGQPIGIVGYSGNRKRITEVKNYERDVRISKSVLHFALRDKKINRWVDPMLYVKPLIEKYSMFMLCLEHKTYRDMPFVETGKIDSASFYNSLDSAYREKIRKKSNIQRYLEAPRLKIRMGIFEKPDKIYENKNGFVLARK